MKIERRFLPGQAEYRAADGEGIGTIAGIAAVFNERSQNLGGFLEVIDPDAFEDTDFSDVRGLFNHNHDKVLGRNTNDSLALSVTDRGLEYVISPPDTQEARDCCTLLRSGLIDQSSFAFFIAPNGREWDEDPDTGQVIATVTKIQRVIDVGPVTYGAYTQTSSAVRSEFVEQSRSEFEAFQRSLNKPNPKNLQRLDLLAADAEARLRGF